ncbi:hypothetical protein MYX84_12160 [Acidobacteria bacterium AH-259-O06]|nr:hypothetical protein [Acidobacteria bacterium AH-259-O06]
MTPLPKKLQKAIKQGELTEKQLRQLIALEAEAIGLSAEEAITLARKRTLPNNHIGGDLSLLVELLPASA